MDYKYKFIIDTNKYAGNFEREMCAYLTGRIGECGVGQEFAALFEKEYEPFENVVDVADEDNGCRRPCEIEIHPGYFNTGMGNHYSRKNKPDDSVILADYAKSIEGYELSHIDNYKHIIKTLNEGGKYSNWTVEAAEREIKRCEKRIETAKKATKYSEYPAYMSVAIFFDSRPSQEQINLMKGRAGTFAGAKRGISTYSWDKNFELEIEGFRFVEIKKEEVETTL